MNTGKKYSKMLFLVLLLVAFVAGCGNSHNNNVAPSSAKAITAFVINAATGTIDEAAKTIAVTVPHATSVTAMVATFATTGVSVKVGGVLQTSGALPANDFTFPVIYTVTAADGSSVDYTVTVTVALATTNTILTYSIASQLSSTITGTAIAVTMPFGTNKVGLIATFTHSGSSVHVGSTLQTSGTTTNNFTGSVSYTVTAANSDIKTYIVTVTNALNPAKLITAYTITSQVSSTIIASAITVTMPFSTPVTALVASFTASPGAVVTVGTTTQVSGTTPNNFTGPVAYKVFPADGSSFATYTVTVHVAPSTSLNLRRTATFGILAGSSITSAGTTTVTGDVGSTSLTGTTLVVLAGTDYSSGTGTVYANAMTDLSLVISDATGTLFPCGPSIAANLTGVALLPGVTCINADAAILNTGIVTLNGAGDYMIRTGGALTPAATSSVAYGGTANATNTTVVWVVGSANLGTPSTWIGTILATTGAVTLGDTDTLVKGRVLTPAAVTVSNNIVTIP